MKFESNLRRARGLGSAKSGLRHWIAQRITAIALIPLGIWFIGAFIILLTAPFAVAYTWFSSLWTVSLAIFFVLALFYHGYLGMEVIWEDYISHERTKWILIISTKLFSVLMALLSIVSLLKIFLTTQPLPERVILGKKCFVFQEKTLAFLGRGSHWQQDPRVKKIHCFSNEKQVFSSPRMTQGESQ